MLENQSKLTVKEQTSAAINQSAFSRRDFIQSSAFTLGALSLLGCRSKSLPSYGNSLQKLPVIFPKKNPAHLASIAQINSQGAIIGTFETLVEQTQFTPLVTDAKLREELRITASEKLYLDAGSRKTYSSLGYFKSGNVYLNVPTLSDQYGDFTNMLVQGLSDDNLVCGTASRVPSSNPLISSKFGFIWNPLKNNIKKLAPLTGHSKSTANGISSDGNTIIGSSTGSANKQTRDTIPCTYEQKNGQWVPWPLPLNSDFHPYQVKHFCISPNGSFATALVGLRQGNNAADSFHSKVYIWKKNPDNSWVVFDTLTKQVRTSTISNQGSIVGEFLSYLPDRVTQVYKPFIYSKRQGFKELDILAGDESGSANTIVENNGRALVFGVSTDPHGKYGGNSLFVWSEKAGTQRLYLPEGPLYSSITFAKYDGKKLLLAGSTSSPQINLKNPRYPIVDGRYQPPKQLKFIVENDAGETRELLVKKDTAISFEIEHQGQTGSISASPRQAKVDIPFREAVFLIEDASQILEGQLKYLEQQQANRQFILREIKRTNQELEAQVIIPHMKQELDLQPVSAANTIKEFLN